MKQSHDFISIFLKIELLYLSGLCQFGKFIKNQLIEIQAKRLTANIIYDKTKQGKKWNQEQKSVFRYKTIKLNFSIDEQLNTEHSAEIQ